MEDIDTLSLALLGKVPDDEKLQNALQWGGYRITMVPGQSAISTDFDFVIVLNFFNNKFVKTPSRHNVWNTRCRILNIILCPEPDLWWQENHGNWDFLCDVLRKLNWFTDFTDHMNTRLPFALCFSDAESHQAFYENCLQPSLQKWKKTMGAERREQFYGTLTNLDHQ